jgi:hypothetical protein
LNLYNGSPALFKSSTFSNGSVSAAEESKNESKDAGVDDDEAMEEHVKFYMLLMRACTLWGGVIIEEGDEVQEEAEVEEESDEVETAARLKRGLEDADGKKEEQEPATVAFIPDPAVSNLATGMIGPFFDDIDPDL